LTWKIVSAVQLAPQCSSLRRELDISFSRAREAKAGRKYGSKAAGKRVAGAILAKQRAKGK